MAIKSNDFIKYKQKTYSVPEIAEKFQLDLTDMSVVIATLNILERQGKIEIVNYASQEEDLVAKAQAQSLFQDAIVKTVIDEEDNEKVLRREKRLQEVDKLSIALPFYQTLQAQKFDNWLTSIGITDTTITKDLKDNSIKLTIKDITPNEYTKISNKYQAENIINATVNMSDKAIKSTTDSVNYVASEVVAPVAKIAGKGAMNLAKGLFHTGLKVGASLLNSGVQAVEETKIAVATDPELLKAGDQLLNAKNNITRKINHQKNKMGGNGIEIL